MNRIEPNAYTAGLVKQTMQIQEQLACFTVEYFKRIEKLGKLNTNGVLGELATILADYNISACVAHVEIDDIGYFEVFNYATGSLKRIKIEEKNGYYKHQLFTCITEQLMETIDHFNNLLRVNEI